MKKILSLVLTFLTSVSVLVGCGFGNDSSTLSDETRGSDSVTQSDETSGSNGTDLPDEMNGSDAARLLLANERLNAQLLKNDGDIFENGVEVMNTLAKTAITNLNVRYASNRAPSVARLSSVRSAPTVLEGDYSGKVEINGDTFSWSGFEENNNSYDYFKNITDNIVFTARLGAEMIDNIKKNVRVVDKWVDVFGVQYYLSVDENSEMLCERNAAINDLKVCRRYKNEDGSDVYELYRKQDNHEERMTYIPGERYELSMIADFDERSEDYFVADNSKGYWETYVVGAFPEHYNVSYFIMKNDVCYDAFYNPEYKNIPLLKIMSADKATDILNFSDCETFSAVNLKFSGFDGIKSVEAPVDSVEYNAAEGYANLSNYDNAKVYLTNGKILNYGDSFLDGRISIDAIRVGYSGGFGYTGEIGLRVEGETYTERLENLKSFLNETGLQCRRDTDSVLNGINKAFVDLESVIKYYKWNGVSVINKAGIGEAIDKEKTRFGDMEALYVAVKDAEVLDLSDTELIELNIKFAPITESGFEGIALDAMNVSVGSISLTIEDTTLYVKDEAYKVAFALVNSNGGLVHFDAENTSSAKYTGGDKFAVTALALEFTLPVLSSGSYTLVAYIATSEGIRTSAYTTVGMNEIVNMPMSIENMTVSAEKEENGALTLAYEQVKDFTVTLTTPNRIGYEEFKTAISEIAFEYGIPSDIIEFEADDAYTALTGSETEIVDGTYRISYSKEDGDIVEQGYIYVQYSCE